MKMIKWIGTAIVSLAVSVNAATWDGGGSNGSWGNVTNWVDNTAPAWGNTLDLYFGASADGTNYIGANRTIRSLNYTVDATGFPRTMLSSNAAGNGTAYTLTFNGGGSGAWIATTAGATAGSYQPFGNNGAVVLADNLTITHNASGQLYLLKAFGETGGSRSVTLNGTSTNTVVFNNAATYSGGTILKSGVLQVNNDSALGTGLLTLDGGTLYTTTNRTLANNVNLAAGGGTIKASTTASRIIELTGIITNSGALTKENAGILKLSGANTYSGGTILNTGLIEANNATALGSGNVTMTGSAGLNVDQDLTIGGSLTAGSSANVINLYNGSRLTVNAGNIGAVIKDSGSIVKTGAGTVLLTSANTHSGGTVLNEGKLMLSNNAALGTGTLTLNGGTLANASYISAANGVNLASNTAISLEAVNVALLLSGSVSGAGGLTVSGVNNTYRFGLSGSNTFSGGVTVNSGALRLNNNYALGSGDLTINGGAIECSANGFTNANNNKIKLNANLNMNPNGGENMNLGGGAVDLGGGTRQMSVWAGDTLTLGGTISNGGLTKAGTGELALSGANTYSAGTTISAGTVRANNATALGSGNVTMTGSALLSLDQNLTIGGTLSGASTTNAINLGSSQLTLSKGSFAGVITDTGSLFKTGTETLTLSGANTYSGTTTISMGMLVINGDQSGATGALTVDAGAILGGSGKIGGMTTVQSGGTLAAGNSPGTLTFAGDLVLAAGSTNIMEITDIARDILMGNGANTLTLNGETVFDFTGFTGGVTNGYTIALGDMFSNWGTISNSGTYSSLGLAGGQSLNFTDGNLTVIPEPATIGMLGLGALVTLVLRRRLYW